MKQNKFACLFLLAAFGAADVYAQSNCEEGDNRRRRPGQAADNCEQGLISTPVTAPEAGRRRTSTGEPESTSDDRLRNRRQEPETVLRKPRLEDYPADIPVPDRWRIVDALYDDQLIDPYNRNTLKGDKPLYDDWFFAGTVMSDSVVETRSVPTPVGSSSTNNPGGLDVIGSGEQTVLNQNLIFELIYYKGNTTFKPPDYEFRFIPVINYNYVELDEVLGVNADPADQETRFDGHVAIQGAFVDIHLRNVSDNYDFDSVRFGIQPFTNDFRGFLFIDSPVGIRLFGNRKNNIFQYNLAWFRRIEKDTNSGLNDIGRSLRNDDIYVANLFWQDTFVKGLFSQFSILHNRNDDDDFFFDENDFIARPASLGLERNREYNVTYLGYALDGHIGRMNITSQIYYVFGEQDEGSVFRQEETDVSAGFVAIEPSIDFSWLRLRASLIYQSGDDDPFDDEDNGFDAIFENPQIAGADTSYWIRQPVPLIGGGRVTLSGRNGILNSLRSSKELGQSNFSNPGLRLIGVGFDADIYPTLRLSGSFNHLSFDETAVIEVARNQGDIDEEIGYDLSLSLTYRPNNIQNIVFRASYARLLAGDGFDALFEDEDPDYFLFNAVLTF